MDEYRSQQLTNTIALKNPSIIEANALTEAKTVIDAVVFIIPLSTEAIISEYYNPQVVN